MDSRRSRAEHNDLVIRNAARAVFLANPDASMADVAKVAGVGMSAVYLRHANKDALIAAICRDGQQRYLDEVRRALSDPDDPWAVYQQWLRTMVEANSHVLVTRLAGRFTPTPDQLKLAGEMAEASSELFERAKSAGAFRGGLNWLDIALMLEGIGSVHVGDMDRDIELRLRLLTIAIDGLRSNHDAPLPGTPPSWDEQRERWSPTT